MLRRYALHQIALLLLATFTAAVSESTATLSIRPEPTIPSAPQCTVPHQHHFQARQATSTVASTVSIPATAAVTPSSLTFVAYCSANSNTYPIGPTTGIPGTDTSLVWDPYGYQQSNDAIPFAQASYTLRVHDERGEGANPTPGYFYGANSQIRFAMYSPAAYTPLASGWTCIGCRSFALSLSVLSHPLAVAIPVTAALVLIGGAGIFNR
ncbi:hypothetical protein P7C70_g3706, partial [Phenoliferia sp. Uapishka_3]